MCRSSSMKPTDTSSGSEQRDLKATEKRDRRVARTDSLAPGSMSGGTHAGSRSVYCSVDHSLDHSVDHFSRLLRHSLIRHPVIPF